MGRHWIGAVLVAACASGVARADGALDARIGAILETGPYRQGHWGLLVVDARTGETVCERNPDRLFAPASVTKLFSGAAALAVLGGDHRFTTPVVRRGDIKDGTLRGDLILVGQGDLSLGGRTGPDGHLLFEDVDHSYAAGNPDASLVAGDPAAGLDHLAREVQAAGIRTVAGDVLVDDRLFEHAASTGSGPSRVSPVVINDNLVDVKVTPAQKPGEPATVIHVPPTAFVTVDAQVETAAEGEAATVEVRPVGPRRFAVRGRIPVGHRPVVKVYEVEDPSDFARTLFIEALRRRGVSVGGSPLAANRREDLPSRDEVAALEKVGEYTSPPFAEYLRVILKVSQNLHASTLPMLLAAEAGETTLEAGLRIEGEQLVKLGVDPVSASFGGGAGGDRADLATPRATVELLRAVARRPDFAAFEAALPVLGRDGTLAKAVGPDSPARGHARAKTGTYVVTNGLDGRAVLTSKALAGYMETASGRPLVFALFVNGVPLAGRDPATISAETAEAGRLLGRICEALYASDAPEPAPTAGPDAP